MPMPPTYRRLILTLVVCMLMTSTVLSSCDQLGSKIDENPNRVSSPSLENVVEINFIAEIPIPLDLDQKLYIEILDEVSGLALNASRHALQAVDDTHYSVKISSPVNSVIKYRYVREGKTTGIEYTSQKRQVRYRLYYASASGVVQDIINAWNDVHTEQTYGRMMGQVVFEGSNQPVAGSLVSVCGQQTFTTSDGSFFIDQVPPGTHNLVVYSPDGSHTTFQQGALVAAGSTTPAVVRVSPSKLIEVSFKISPPDGSPTGIPIRIIGNILGLGNSFGDLRGGLNAVANRAPLLTYSEDGTYAIKLQLPAGFDFQYKYTLGDGFWNAELYTDGRPRLRQFIVPEDDITLNEKIESWNTPGLAPITFTITTPSVTPVSDQISIQFNPYGWTETIPMWPVGEGRWAYILYNPLNFIGETGYRFCRNDQCGIADNSDTPGVDGRAPTFVPNAEAQLIDTTIKKWMWIEENSVPITVPSYEIASKADVFSTGVEFSAAYHPSWQPYLGQSFLRLGQIKSEWVILSPTWHWLSSNPPALGPILGLDISWQDLTQSIRLAQAAGLKVAIRPSTAFTEPASIWWANSIRDEDWWQTWFDRYRLYILNSADIAEFTGANALILGDENLLPALPGGLLGDQTSGVPADVEQRWLELITEIRGRYRGTLIWRTVGLSSEQTLPLLGQMDGLFVIYAQKLSDSDPLNPVELEQAWINTFENDLRSLRDRVDKPVWIGLSYPSVAKSATGCILSGENCLPAGVFAQAGLDIPGTTIDLKEQAEIYNAAYQAVNQIDWISGVFSIGYYPPVALQDKSLSIHGKPAEDVTWFWFEKFNQSP